MKNALFAFQLLIISALSQAEELTYDSYRIIGESTQLAGKAQPVTYVITYNPTMAVLVLSQGASTIRKIRSGSLDGCTRLSPAKQDHFEQLAVKMYVPVSETEMAIQLGAQIDATRRRTHASNMAFVKFINDAIGNSYYSCGQWPAEPKK